MNSRGTEPEGHLIQGSDTVRDPTSRQSQLVLNLSTVNGMFLVNLT